MQPGLVRCAATVAFLLGWALIGIAQADEGPSARFHQERARSAFQAGRYEKALEHFLAVQRLVSSDGTTLNIALCFNRLKRSREEFFYLSKFVRFATDDPLWAAELGFAKTRLEQLEAKIAQVLVQSVPPGAEIYVGDKGLGSFGVTPLVLALQPGKTTLWLKKPGHHEARVAVTAKLGAQVERSVTLRRIEGRLEVRTNPPGEALVTEESGETVASGATPLEAALPPGVYVVEASAPRHRMVRELVRVADDEATTVDVDLEPLPTPQAEVNVSSNPSGAALYVDGEAIGVAPSAGMSIPPGQRTFRIEAAGFQPYEGSFQLDPTKYSLAVALEPPPQLERSPTTWVMGGLGLAALTAGTITGILALTTKNEFDRLREAPDGTDLTRLHGQGVALASTTDGLLIGGGISLGIGALLYFLTEKTSDRRSRGDMTELRGPAAGSRPLGEKD